MRREIDEDGFIIRDIPIFNYDFKKETSFKNILQKIPKIQYGVLEDTVRDPNWLSSTNKYKSKLGDVEARAIRAEIDSTEASREIERLREQVAQGVPAEVERLKRENVDLRNQTATAEYKADQMQRTAAKAEESLQSERQTRIKAEMQVSAITDEIWKARMRVQEAEKQARNAADEVVKATKRAQMAEEALKRVQMGATTPKSESWDPKGYFRILGITDSSIARRVTSEQLQRLFRAQSIILHPDTGGDTKQMQQLSAAFDFLRDSNNRRFYGR